MPTEMSAVDGSCAAVLERLASGRLADFAGLPGGCKLADVERAWGPAMAHSVAAQLGRDRVKTDHRRFQVSGHDQPARVWHDGDRVLLVDLEYPGLGEDADSLRKTLGAPDAEESFSWGVLVLEKAEWVYARRGLTLFVNPETREVLRWAAYAPTDAAAYLRRLELRLAERELPLR